MRELDVNATLVVTCPFDAEVTPTEFDIAVGIAGATRLMLKDMHAKTIGVDGDQPKPSALAAFFREVVKHGLRGMRFFYGADGIPVAYETELVAGLTVVSARVLDRLERTITPGTGYDTLLNWLGAEIWQRTTMSAEQKKTFDERLRSVIIANSTPASSGTTTTTGVTDDDTTTPIN